jgi:anion-transporting  ArsA/GET3 family ATPase
MNELETLVTDPSFSTIVCLGTGGVGKTTTAAALGVLAAQHGRRCLVITIDPAARLAQALGMDEWGASAEPVDIPHVPGLSLLQLNPSAVFDDAIRSALPAHRNESLLTNRYYRIVADAFAGSTDYMAIELLGRLRAQEATPWDLLIVDTAPSVSALEVLDAPDRLAAFTDSRFVKLLRGVLPNEATNKGNRVVRSAMSLILGEALITGIAEMLNGVHEALMAMRERARHTLQNLKSESTAFILVTRPAAAQISEAREFTDQVRQRGFDLHLCVVNQVQSSAMIPGETADVLRTIARSLEGELTNSAAQNVAEAIRVRIEKLRQQEIAHELVTEIQKATCSPVVRLLRAHTLDDVSSLAQLIDRAY